MHILQLLIAMDGDSSRLDDTTYCRKYDFYASLYCPLQKKNYIRFLVVVGAVLTILRLLQTRHKGLYILQTLELLLVDGVKTRHMYYMPHTGHIFFI
jgi:hypothetical protein